MGREGANRLGNPPNATKLIGLAVCCEDKDLPACWHCLGLSVCRLIHFV